MVGGEDDHLVGARRARRRLRSAGGRVEVGEHADAPARPVGLPSTDAFDLGGRLGLVTRAKRARRRAAAGGRCRGVRPRRATRRDEDHLAGQLVVTSLRHVGSVRPLRGRPGIGAYPGRMPTTRLVIIGAGPAGNTCATVAASLGADMTLIERDVVGGAAHLWDCIPSKALIATGAELAELTRAPRMGLKAHGSLDIAALRGRVSDIQAHLHDQLRTLLTSQNVRLIHGVARLRTRTPWWSTRRTDRGARGGHRAGLHGLAAPDPRFRHRRRRASAHNRKSYPPPEIPERHTIIIGSGVTGVEFTHMFASLGAKVTLLVSRQQVLPIKDTEVAAVLEDAFLERGVELLKGARASEVTRTGDTVCVTCRGTRAASRGRTPCWRSGRCRTRGAGPRGGGARGGRPRLPVGEPQLPHQRRAHLRGR